MSFGIILRSSMISLPSVAIILPMSILCNHIKKY